MYGDRDRAQRRAENLRFCFGVFSLNAPIGSPKLFLTAPAEAVQRGSTTFRGAKLLSPPHDRALRDVGTPLHKNGAEATTRTTSRARKAGNRRRRDVCGMNRTSRALLRRRPQDVELHAGL